jgi:hypothetical protein
MPLQWDHGKMCVFFKYFFFIKFQVKRNVFVNSDAKSYANFVAIYIQINKDFASLRSSGLRKN